MAKGKKNKTCDTQGRITLYLWPIVFGLLIAGCAANQGPEARTSFCLAGVEKSKIMEAAEDVLGQMHFAIDKSDIEGGFIKTRPLRAAQLFEFWRSDNTGAFNTAEANLNTIRRIAQLTVSPQEGKLCVRCRVHTYRLNLPERKVTSSAEAYQIFSRSKPSIQKFRLTAEQKHGMAWINLGEDIGLSAEILNRLENQLKVK